MLPPGESYGLSAEADFDPRAGLAASDRGKPERFGSRRQQLVVLAEPEILDRGPGCERDELEVNRQLALRPSGDVAGIDGEPVREIEHRVRDVREPHALLDPERRRRVAP